MRQLLRQSIACFTSVCWQAECPVLSYLPICFVYLSSVYFVGVFSYIEHSLRHTLAYALNMCIESRRCIQCEHRHGNLHAASIAINILFTCVAMYHLAYLGVMFDTSESGEQEKGYSMLHTLRKWRDLDYSSHIFATCTFIFYWLIK